MSKPKLKPNGKRILLQMDPPDQKIGSIHIPKNAQETQAWGTVISISEKIEDDISPGDRILISDHFGTHYTERVTGSDEKQSFIIIDRRHCLLHEKAA